MGGHYCSWFDGATDNASGHSCLIELAKLFTKHQDALTYGIRIAWWPGHSNGRYAGSAWYAETFWQDLYDNCIAYFNIDSPGVRGATLHVPRDQMAEVSAFNEACVAELSEGALVNRPSDQLAHGIRPGKYANNSRPNRNGDQSFWGVGVTSIGVYCMIPPDGKERHKDVSGSGGGWWWHSIDDTEDKCDPAILLKDTQLNWSIMFRLLSSEVLPYDFAATAGDYADTLREYMEEAGDKLDFGALPANIAQLREKAATFAAAGKNLTGEAAARATRLNLQLARTLNPILYTNVERFTQQRAVGTRFLPDLAPCLRLAKMDPETWDFKLLRNTLNRKVTKVNFAVLTAIRLLDSWKG